MQCRRVCGVAAQALRLGFSPPADALRRGRRLATSRGPTRPTVPEPSPPRGHRRARGRADACAAELRVVRLCPPYRTGSGPRGRVAAAATIGDASGRHVGPPSQRLNTAPQGSRAESHAQRPSISLCRVKDQRSEKYSTAAHSCAVGTPPAVDAWLRGAILASVRVDAA